MFTDTIKRQILENQTTAIQCDLLKQTYSKLPLFSITAIMYIAAISYAFYSQLSQQYHIRIAALLSLIFIFSAYYIIKARKTTIKPDKLLYWNNRLIVIVFTRSVLWGSVVLFFYIPGIVSIEYQLGLFVILLLVVTQKTLITSADKKIFFITAIPTLLPIMVQLLLSDNELFQFIILASVVYLSILFIFYYKSNISLKESSLYRLEKINLLEQLETQSKETRQKHITNSRFLASASHDLRQPIHAQTLLIEELLERIDDPKLIHLIRDLKISTNTLHELFDSLLDISKLDSGTIKPEIEVFSLREMMDGIELEYREFAYDKNLKFRIAVPDINIKSDRNLLTRIIQNLVSNAIKYTKEGSVLVVARRRGDKLRIEVRDSGTGIPKNQQDIMFQEFYQLNTINSRHIDSLGLGLSIVQRLSKLLHHKLEVKSRVEQGSVFSLLVPTSNIQLLTDTAKLRPTCDLETFTRNSILVIDNEELIRRSMFNLLSHWGCEVTTVASGNEALAFINSDASNPELIIADYQLDNGKTGLQAINRINSQLKRDIPALIITGHTANVTISKIKKNGFEVLHKPVAPAKLRALIRFILDENTINFDEQSKLKIE